MLISLVYYPVTTLGPGKRIGIWTSGCHRSCFNCMSNFAKDFDSKKERSIESIISEIKDINKNNEVDGITISGGEPLLQNDLENLLIEIRNLGIDDILLYTGYQIEEIQDRVGILSNIDILIDGPYIDELNDNQPLRGSSNQRIILINDDLKDKYLQYLKQPRTCTMNVENEYITIIGLLPKGGLDQIMDIINKK